MNKNKIIFAIIGTLLLALILLIAVKSNSSNDSKVNTVKQAAGDFQIWILNDDKGDFQDIIADFKLAYPIYSSKNVIIESFDDWQTYTNALSSAIFSGQAPDIFVLNNSETSLFENQIQGVDPALVSPNEFRLNFATIFGEDLIVTDPNDNTVEFLKGVPAGYEALGIFYNRKYFLRPSEMQTWSDFAREIQNIAKKYSSIIPVALGNGVGVNRANEIISALMVLEGRKSLVTTGSAQSKQVLAMYNSFSQRDGDNRYNILSAPFIDDRDIEFFTQGDVAAMIGYPRDLLDIDKIGYQKSFLFATPFPHYAGSDNMTSIDYNYFSINKNTIHADMAGAFMSYLASSRGQQAYVDTFPYYLSANVEISIAMSEKKILPAYNIVYKNFMSDGAELVSYDVGNKALYDTQIPHVLDMDSGYDTSFTKLSSYITCSSTKQNTLLNLSSPCK